MHNFLKITSNTSSYQLYGPVVAYVQTNEVLRVKKKTIMDEFAMKRKGSV
jgi:hypothetical protein